MSADRWSICPKCGRTADAIRAERQQAVEAAYGTLPRAEWEAMVAEADKPVEVYETLREDWDIYLTNDAIVHVAYKAHCDKCGARAEFKHEHPLVSPPQSDEAKAQ